MGEEDSVLLCGSRLAVAEDWKKKYGDTKVKVSKDGDIKVKDENGKIKYDADDKKIKTDTSD